MKAAFERALRAAALNMLDAPSTPRTRARAVATRKTWTRSRHRPVPPTQSLVRPKHSLPHNTHPYLHSREMPSSGG